MPTATAPGGECVPAAMVPCGERALPTNLRGGRSGSKLPARRTAKTTHAYHNPSTLQAGGVSPEGNAYCAVGRPRSA
eukprot:scaffold80967_cov60-Phaeocystis_antarctica.AAC.1